MQGQVRQYECAKLTSFILQNIELQAPANYLKSWSQVVDWAETVATLAVQKQKKMVNQLCLIVRLCLIAKSSSSACKPSAATIPPAREGALPPEAQAAVHALIDAAGSPAAPAGAAAAASEEDDVPVVISA